MHGSRLRGGIEPSYFGTSGKRLFGCYHAPQSGPSRDCGAVLCYPMGQEYIRSHRSYRQLAARLSNAGFPVLRFDFYGCGDSTGDCTQGQIRQWLRDISTAVDELKGRSGLVKICLVGLRLGGTLSMMIGAERGDIDGMVLWNPVVGGRAYIEELRTLHEEELGYSSVEPKRRIKIQKHTEILGFALTDLLLTNLEKIDLLAIQHKPANNILLIDSHEEAHEERFREHLTTIGAHVEYQHLPSAKIWIEEPYKGLVPQQVLQSVVSWVSEVYS